MKREKNELIISAKLCQKLTVFFLFLSSFFFSGEGKTGNVAEFEEDRLLEIL